jgi:hypothetical protein
VDFPPDPFAEAWKGLGIALVGGIVYLLLDLLVLRHNVSFQKGSKLFRTGFVVLWIGVCLSSTSWFFFAHANTKGTLTTLYISYAVRAIGVVGLITGLVKMGRKSET